jgi:hypothetical protein
MIKQSIIAGLLVLEMEAAVLYCGPSSSGGNSGADFSNLLDFDSVTPVRGNEYVIIEGSYLAKTLNIANSSTTGIIIRKANSSDSAVAGYSTTLFDSAATFASLNITTDYWQIDGVTRNESSWTTSSAYGITVTGGVTLGPEVNDITLEYLYLPGDGTGNSKSIDMTDQTGTTWRSNITISRCYMNNVGLGIHSREASSVTVEYCHISNTYSKEAISHQYGHNWILRWCDFVDCGLDGPEGQTAVIGVFNFSGGGDPSDTQADGWKLYGLTFYCTTSLLQDEMIAQDGLIMTDGPDNWEFYNITVARTGGAWGGAFRLANNTGTIMRNVLWYDMGDYDVDWGSIITTPTDTDQSWCYYLNVKPARLGFDCSNINGTVISGSENPFHDYAGNDFRIKATSFSGNSPIGQADTSIAEIYRTDKYGNVHSNIGALGTFGEEGGGTSGGGSGEQRVTINGNVTFNGNITK